LKVWLALLLLAAPAAAFEPVTYRSADGTTIEALLQRPATPAPHPSIVMLHGCAGRDSPRGGVAAREADWAQRFVAAGYAVLLPESFRSRDAASQCTVRDRRILPWQERRADAEGAQHFLAAQPWADRARIALLGWSHGGSTVLAAFDLPGYAAFVAFYPGCSRSLRAQGPLPSVPALILIGHADDWTPAEPCRRLSGFGSRIAYQEYAGAYHGFDAPDQPVRLRTGLAFSVRGDGTAHLGTDPAARADALRRVPEFLASAMQRNR
jgi:dienelactone hydrolase